VHRLTLILLALAVAAGAAFGEEIDRGRASHAAGSLIERAITGGSRDLIPAETLADAVLGDVITVHHPLTLESSYGVVPVRTRSGRLIGIVGVDAVGDRWLWCTFNYPHTDFPVVQADRAASRLQAHRRSLGLNGDIPEPILIQGCDKHLYWSFQDRHGERWLVDAVAGDARILRSSSRALCPALTPAEAVGRSGGGPGALTESDRPETPVLTETPGAYNIPGVPYHFQITSWYCGPASLQMVMDYWGEEIDQDDIADVANDIVNEGTYRDDMRRAAHFSGMSTCIQNPLLVGYNERKLGYACMEAEFMSNPSQKLKNTVYANYPVFILTWFSPVHTAGHYRVVKGWDEYLEAFIIHDPWYYGTISGPDLIMSETMLVDDLWQYSTYWAMVACPWEITPSIPTSISVGDTFSIDLRVVYPGPTRFSGQFGATGCEASITLPGGLALVDGTEAQALPDMDSGDTTLVTWDVVALGQGDFDVAFRALGTVSGSSLSYPEYSDTIGGHALETVVVGGGLVSGWDSEQQLTSDAGSSLLCFPGARSMILGDDGDIHLVWADTEYGTNDIFYMKNSGGTWDSPVVVSDQPGFSTTPCVAKGPGGRIHIAWVDGRDGNNEIYYRYWDPSLGWSAEERVTAEAEVDYCPAIAAGDTAVYLAWERRMGGAYRVSAVFFSERSSLGWSVPIDVDASAARDSYHPSLAYGPDGILSLAYERQTANDPDEHERIVLKTWNGVSWSARTGISDEVAFSRYPCIAAGSDTTLHLVWQDGAETYGAIYYAYYDGAAWQPAIQISPEGVEATTPSVSVDGSATAHIVWSDHRHVDTEIYYVRCDHLTPTGETRLSYACGHSTVPTVAAGGSGEVCTVWCDLRNGNADLYFRAADNQSGVPVAGPLPAGGRGVVLEAPYPNPSASATTIGFALDRRANMTVQVFDVEGRLVDILGDGFYEAGTHSTVWDGRTTDGEKAGAGIYFIRCKSPIGEDVRRVVLVR
jgi:hypothetical protein